MILFCFLFLFCKVSVAYGSGFAIYTQSASSLAQSAATIAHAEDPSAIFFNPALINKLSGTQTQVGTTFIFPSREFKSDRTGKTEETEDNFFFPSTFYTTHKFNNKLSAGLGVFTPFGLSTDWPDDWEGRYIATKSEMETYNLNPVLSYRLTPGITMAAGLNYLWLDASLQKKINFSPYGLPDGEQKFEGDGDGFGYNLGFLLEPHEDIAVGVSYRSEIEVDIDDADATFRLPNQTPTSIRSLFPNTGANTEIDLPQQFHFGVCYKGFSPFTIEAGLRWEGWSSFDRLKIDLDDPVAGKKAAITNRDWEDTWSGNLGLKYQLNKYIALLGGYLYQDNPVPDKTFDPSIPDANGHLFSLGTNLKYESFRFSFALAFQHLESRSKDNAVDDNSNDEYINSLTSANGEYESDLYMFGVDLTYVF